MILIAVLDFCQSSTGVTHTEYLPTHHWTWGEIIEDLAATPPETVAAIS